MTAPAVFVTAAQRSWVRHPDDTPSRAASPAVTRTDARLDAGGADLQQAQLDGFQQAFTAAAGLAAIAIVVAIALLRPAREAADDFDRDAPGQLAPEMERASTP